AYDRNHIGTGGGSIVGGVARAGVGAGVTYSHIQNKVEADLDASVLTGFDRLSVAARNATRIAAATGSLASIPMATSATFGGVIVVNEVANTTSATITGGARIDTARGVSLAAHDGAVDIDLDDLIAGAGVKDGEAASETIEYDFSGDSI